ncbi:MAG: zinc-dependent alcohol dehydrogenase family protein [Solirubrobacterales bacterium]|nr:zinc-dependent alcohol dehydrogenase family protein [Solirubrobacterales bacterium]
MRAIILERQGEPLKLTTLPEPAPAPGQLKLKIGACGVCRTDLHLRDSEIPATKLPITLGHQIVGRTDDGRRFGVPWLGWTDGTCRFCTTGRENLCPSARFTGRDFDGGYAEYTVADERYCFELPDELTDEQAAPLLCGGLIGYRSLKLAGDAPRLGLYGFGSAAHMICQAAAHQGREVYAFTRPGDRRTQAFAKQLGARWAGGSDERPPELLDAAIIFASAGELVPAALKILDRDGTVVCAGIHMTDIPAFPYDDLYDEKKIRSVANLTRQDGHEWLALAREAQIRTSITKYPLDNAEQALADLRSGAFEGSAVIVP